MTDSQLFIAIGPGFHPGYHVATQHGRLQGSRCVFVFVFQRCAEICFDDLVTDGYNTEWLLIYLIYNKYRIYNYYDVCTCIQLCMYISISIGIPHVQCIQS